MGLERVNLTHSPTLRPLVTAKHRVVKFQELSPSMELFTPREDKYSSAMADRQCDCLCPKSPLCCCQHCQWFCAGQDAVAIRQARITRPKRHLPNAYEILVTRYDQFRTGWVSFGEYFTGKRASPTNHCWCQKTRVIAVSCGVKISPVRCLVLSQYTRLSDGRTDGRTDRQTDRIATAKPCTVKQVQ